MESVSLKLEPKFLREIEKAMGKNKYMTKAEFIREAIRDKMKELEKKEALEDLRKVFGSSRHKTTNEDLHKAGEKAFQEFEKEFGIK